MKPQTTRVSLLSRVRDHADHVAWSEFDERYRELILRYCQRRGLQASDAEDVRQLVMLNLARQLRTFQYDPKKGRFRDYLGRTVQNAIHRLFRRPRPERVGLDTDVAAALPARDGEELDQEWEREWMDHHYRLALEGVRKTADPKSVDVFDELLAGGDTESVARSFQMTRDAVHKVKQRMRERLKVRIAEQIREEEELED